MRRPVQELLPIASAGGGFQLSWRHHTLEKLMHIAAAGGGRATITIADAEREPLQQLVRVAGAGRGAVVFAPDA